MSGPIISAREITGWFGKAEKAIARAMGEFRARGGILRLLYPGKKSAANANHDFQMRNGKAIKKNSDQYSIYAFLSTIRKHAFPI